MKDNAPVRKACAAIAFMVAIVASAPPTMSLQPSDMLVAQLCAPVNMDMPCTSAFGDHKCRDDGQHDYEFPSMLAGFNDVVSSVSGFNNCWVGLYEDANFQGGYVECRPDCTDLSLVTYDNGNSADNSASSYKLL